MVRAAIYTRISQDRLGEALGVARQEAECRDLASRLGWQVREVFTDNDVSATSRKPRPAYERMVEAVRRGEIDAVICWDVDRLTRRPRELEDWVDFAQAHGLALASVGGDCDLATEQGRLMARMKGSVARYEAEQTARRARAKHAERAARGLPSGGGTRPYGFENDRMTHRVEEAVIVREAVDLLLNGASLRSVCHRLNQRGDTTSTGRMWTPNVLKKVVTGARWGGFRQHHDKLLEACWDPIIDRDKWIQLRKELQAEGRRSTQTFARQHHWTGLLTCSRCGNLMGARMVGGRYSYSCRAMTRSSLDGREFGCQGVTIRKQETDELLDDLLLTAIEQEDLGSAAPDDDRAMLERRVAEEEGRLHALATEHANGSLDLDAYRAASHLIVARIEEARQDLFLAHQRSLRPVELDPAMVRATWPSLSPSERRAIAGLLIKRVLVAPVRNRGDNRFDPSRLSVEWL